MERTEAEHYEEAQDIDVRALKRMMAKREDALEAFRRTKDTLLQRGPSGNVPRQDRPPH
jgi:hypothetical protein